MPIPATRRHAKGVDYEYEVRRNGEHLHVCRVTGGSGEVAVRETKTKVDWASRNQDRRKSLAMPSSTRFPYAGNDCIKRIVQRLPPSCRLGSRRQGLEVPERHRLPVAGAGE